MNDKKTVLIADDDPSLRKGMEVKFKASGFNVITASDGEEAINYALERKPDLIVMDQLMPKFTGLAAIKRIRADFDWGRHVPIIVMTNVAEGTSAHRELILVSTRYFVKSNTSLDTLLKTSRELLGIELKTDSAQNPTPPTAETTQPSEKTDMNSEVQKEQSVDNTATTESAKGQPNQNESDLDTTNSGTTSQNISNEADADVVSKTSLAQSESSLPVEQATEESGQTPVEETISATTDNATPLTDQNQNQQQNQVEQNNNVQNTPQVQTSEDDNFDQQAL